MAIIQGSVVDVLDGYGYVWPIRPDREEVNGHVLFKFRDVIDGRTLQQGDRVELEAELADKGWRAKWVRYEGPALPLVEGEGYIRSISKDGRMAVIQPDTQGADDVRLYSETSLRREWNVRDRIRFIARAGTNGRWKAISVEKLPTPERSWRDSWTEMNCTDNGL